MSAVSSSRVCDQFISFEDARRIAMTRFGLHADKQDFTIFRILDLARRALGAEISTFSIPVRGAVTFACVSGAEMQGCAIASHCCRRSLAGTAVQVIQGLQNDFELQRNPLLKNRGIRSYVGKNILCGGQEVVGAMSMFYGGNAPAMSSEYLQMLNDYGRLLEDSLESRHRRQTDPQLRCG